MVKVSSSILRYMREGMPLRSPYPERSAGPLNSAENSAASFASSTWAAAASSRFPKRALKAAVKAASFLKGVVTPCTPICTDASWAKYGVAQARASPLSRLSATCTLSSMVVNDVLINHGGGEEASGSPCRGRLWGKTLPASGGTEDAAGAEAAVVAFRWSNFERSECSSGLSAESAVKVPKEVRQRGYALALAQGLEGDLLALDLDRRRQFEGGGSWGRQGKSAARQIGMQGCFADRADVALIGSPCSVGSPLGLIGVFGSGTVAARNGR
ncbi:predicted protein [Postia placenta Mad-698-R]|nr:predicted protein [Postia placenta Mad-698-R]